MSFRKFWAEFTKIMDVWIEYDSLGPYVEGYIDGVFVCIGPFPSEIEARQYIEDGCPSL